MSKKSVTSFKETRVSQVGFSDLVTKLNLSALPNEQLLELVLSGSATLGVYFGSPGFCENVRTPLHVVVAEISRRMESFAEAE